MSHPPFTHAASAHEAFVQAETRAGRSPLPAPARVPADAIAIVDFWREAGPTRWFAKDPEFDRMFRERFMPLYNQAERGRLADWLAAPESALALLILLDQFPRNSFRGTPRMYATDPLAREMADAAIRAGYDQLIEPALRLFVYLPFGHSEYLADQERSVALVASLGEPSHSHAQHHRDIVRRFGRFPHRNQILGRALTPEEQQFLDAGGYAG